MINLTYNRIDNTKVTLPLLRLFGNIVTGNAKQTQKVINSGILPYLKNFLNHEKPSIRKESCWIVSNLAAGADHQIGLLITSGFLPLLGKIIRLDKNEVTILINGYGI